MNRDIPGRTPARPHLPTSMGDPMFRNFASQIGTQVEVTSTMSGVLLMLFLAAKGVAKLTEGHARVSGALDSFADVIGQSVAFYATAMTSVATERRFLPELARHGWLISPMAPWDEPQVLDRLYREQGIAGVEQHLLDQLDNATCRDIVSRLRTRESFRAWASTFEKALIAHERGDYELAIPIWLIALEGIIESETGVESVFSQKVARRVRVSLKVKLTPGFGYDVMAEAWLEVLTGFGRSSKAATPALLSRHAVLHGKRPLIGNRRDSTQCILALEVLHFLLAATDAAAASGLAFFHPLQRPSLSVRAGQPTRTRLTK